MTEPQHPRHVHHSLTRRTAIQAGSIGLMGLGMAELSALRELNGAEPTPPAKSVIFIFLTGGLSHQDTFDLKPNASATVRGEFQPISTNATGIQICEHLPMLAQRSQHWALVRSVGTASSGHGPACHMLLTGRMDLPGGFDTNGPTPNDWPSIPAMATYALRGKTNLPPAAVLPQPSINEAGKVRPGQYAGRLGREWEAWHIDIAAKCPLGNGACPDCFRFDGSPFEHASDTILDTPFLTLPQGGRSRLDQRLGLLAGIEQQRRDLERVADVERLDRNRQQAISVLADPKTAAAFDVEHADPKTLARYGKNKFGLSLLMAQRLVTAGVSLVQVNLGKNSTWDTHDRNFVNLKDNLLPPTDRAVSALLDDLHDSGQLEDTLVVMTGEFGRTPIINKRGGRDHWGPVMTQLYAGGGVRGGTIVGSSDKTAAYPETDKQSPENFAATIYQALGIPRSTRWKNIDGEMQPLYRGEPIERLTTG